jgi:hypothetical protein
MKRDTAITLSFRDREIIVRRNSTYRTYTRTVDKMREIDRKLENSLIEGNVSRPSYSIYHSTYSNQSFKLWLAEVDAHISAELGCSLHDLEDYTWRDYYEDNVSPEDTAHEYISDWKYDHGLLEQDPPAKKVDPLTASLVTIRALDRFPDIIDNYEMIHTAKCVEDHKHGTYAWKFPEYDTLCQYDPAVDVWLVHRAIREGDNVTFWNWDSVDLKWQPSKPIELRG